MVVPGIQLPVNQESALARITQTDSNGRYRLDDIPSGRYFIVAGPLSFPTFHPGTLVPDAATIVTISQDGETRTGIDFALNTAPSTVPSGSLASGQIVTEDGSPVPNVRMTVVSVNGVSTVTEDGSFRIPLRVGTGQFAVQGLPPGYFLKSVKYGAKNFSPGSVLIDGMSPPTFVLTLGFESVSTLQRVTARGKFANIAAELNAVSLSLVSTLPGGPTFDAQLQPDSTFDFSSVPIGAYRAGVRDAAGNAYIFSVTTVIASSVSGRVLDLGNNPFPEFESAYTIRSPFFGGRKIEITGVATQKLTRIHPREDVAYFRMDVKDERTGAVVPWAIHVEHEWQVPKITVGETLTVQGVLSADGTNRLTAYPF
jgi:hypothetical protein